MKDLLITLFLAITMLALLVYAFTYLAWYAGYGIGIVGWFICLGSIVFYTSLFTWLIGREYRQYLERKNSPPF